MKWKFEAGMLAGLGIVALIAIIMAILGCKIKVVPQESRDNATEITVEDSIQSDVSSSNILEKTYKFVTDVSSDHQELVSDLSYIETYKNMPAETVQNVATLLLRARPSITIPEIVDEYKANKNIYDNIVPNAISDQNSDTGPAIKSDQQITKELSSYQQTARDSVPDVRIVERKQ